MHKLVITLFFALLSLSLRAADSETPEGSAILYAVTVQMHDGGSFTIKVGTDPVKIKITPDQTKTISSIMLGDTDITALLDADGNITLNAPGNESLTITADTIITVTYSSTEQE